MFGKMLQIVGMAVLLQALVFSPVTMAQDVPTKSFNVSLDSGPEIPPVVANSPPANGYAIIEFSGPNFVAYKLFVNNGVEVTQAHIHQGPSDGTGPVVVFLFPVAGTGPITPQPGTETNGLLAEGTFSASELIGPLKGKTIYDLFMQATNNNLYVNVHNVQNKEGFIRGQF